MGDAIHAGLGGGEFQEGFAFKIQYLLFRNEFTPGPVATAQDPGQGAGGDQVMGCGNTFMLEGVEHRLHGVKAFRAEGSEPGRGWR